MPIDWDAEDSEDGEPSVYDQSVELENERKAAVEQAVVLAMLQWRMVKREFGIN